jgi:GNAT superfamily N-acetyltransferase
MEQYTIEVREMKLDDVDMVVKIYSEIYNASYVSFGELAAGLADSPASPTENASNLFQEEIVNLITSSDTGTRQIVATVDNDIAGFALASLENTIAGHLECWLNDMGVLPDYQGKRIGKKLVEDVIAWGSKGNAKYFLLESGLDNENAHHFFEGVGFHPMSIVFYRDASQ